MDLGNFSISLNVVDIEKSVAFYRVLGFEDVIGNIEDKWLVLRNGKGVVGLFEGMLQENTMTFNPLDVRAVQEVVKASGYAIEKEAEGTDGPAHFILRDPDGNVILMDQH